MLLQQLKLHNIRSYREETVIFPEGTTLLAGDIGSGKSTILLAIEFALFGTSRPDLPGENLLRKGAVQGSVELTFQLGNKTIIIKRPLKKEKDQVKQMAGYFVLNGSKRDLMPVELKAEIISLLGYPDDALTKNKNYIFRYTIYTPQEEMKHILQEDAELRLDTLRRIFNLDKYKIIRENCSPFLKTVRDQMRVMEAKLEPLDSFQRQIQDILHEHGILANSIQLAEENVNRLRSILQTHQQELERLEQHQIRYTDLMNRQQSLKILLRDKEAQFHTLIQKEKQIQIEFLEIEVPEGRNVQDVEREKEEIEQKRSRTMTRVSLLQERSNYLEMQIQTVSREISLILENLARLPEKHKHIHTVNEEILAGKSLPQKKVQIDELLLTTADMVSRNEILLHQSHNLVDTIMTLDQCPVCLQDVSSVHKSTIRMQEEEKMKQAEQVLLESRQKNQHLRDQKKQLEEDHQLLVQKEKVYNRLELEILQLQEKEKDLQQKENQLRVWRENQAEIRLELAELHATGQMEILQQQAAKCNQIWQNLLKRQQMSLHLHDLKLQLIEVQTQKNSMEENLQILEATLFHMKDLAPEMSQKKSALSMLLQEEKAASVRQAEMQTQLAGIQKQRGQIQVQIDNLLSLKTKLKFQQELHHWLEEYFLNLTYTIEKHVMVNVHRRFNQLFQEWFSILIDDESVTSRIDDSFTPIIEQNGYEVSFLNLSGGEKTSAALAYRLALNRVINDVIHDIKTKDILILDEPTDGFSSDQLDKVREVLERLNLRQTIIVSHESKIESFVNHVIRVQKEGHVSSVR